MICQKCNKNEAIGGWVICRSCFVFPQIKLKRSFKKEKKEHFYSKTRAMIRAGCACPLCGKYNPNPSFVCIKHSKLIGGWIQSGGEEVANLWLDRYIRRKEVLVSLSQFALKYKIEI
jgi:hypothetical protein